MRKAFVTAGHRLIECTNQLDQSSISFLQEDSKNAAVASAAKEHSLQAELREAHRSALQEKVSSYVVLSSESWPAWHDKLCFKLEIWTSICPKRLWKIIHSENPDLTLENDPDITKISRDISLNLYLFWSLVLVMLFMPFFRTCNDIVQSSYLAFTFFHRGNHSHQMVVQTESKDAIRKVEDHLQAVKRDLEGQLAEMTNAKVCSGRDTNSWRSILICCPTAWCYDDSVVQGSIIFLGQCNFGVSSGKSLTSNEVRSLTA